MNDIDQFIDNASFLTFAEKEICKHLSTREEKITYLEEKHHART